MKSVQFLAVAGICIGVVVGTVVLWNFKEVPIPEVSTTTNGPDESHPVEKATATMSTNPTNLAGPATSTEYLAVVVAKDIAAGINAEVRTREKELGERAARIPVGSTVSNVLESFGEPDLVQIIEPGTRTCVRGVDNVPPGKAFEMSFLPRTGMPFDGRNGQGYRAIVFHFGTNALLDRCGKGDVMIYCGGTMGMVQRQTEFWNGKHEKSPPPSEESVLCSFSISPVEAKL